MRALPSCLLLLVVFLVAGCGARSYPPPRSVYDFPSRAEVVRLQRSPMPTPIFQSEAIEAPGWQLEGPFADPGAEPDPELTEGTPWDEIFPGATAVELRPAMRCAAREMGRFLLDHGGLPTQGLQRFMRLRCGVTTANRVLQAVRLAEASDGVTAEDLRSEWMDGITRDLSAPLGEGRWLAGTWFGRAEGRAVLVVLAARPRAVFSADSPRVDENGGVRIRGRVLGPVGHLLGLVNQGHHGVERCEQDPSPRSWQ